MIYWIPVFSLILSLFLPWYFISILAAGVYAFRKPDRKEIFLLFGIILILISFASVFYDLRADGLVSERMSALFSLPFQWLFHLFVGLVPASLFLSTAYVVSESRNLVKRRARDSEKRR